MTTLLTAAQKKACLAREQTPAPDGPRAKALLALNSGATQQQAAADSGLSIGQVRYCLRRFRSVALGIFDSAATTAAGPVKADEKANTPATDTKKKVKKIKPLKPVKAKKDKSDKNSDKKNSKKGKKSDKKEKKKTSDKKGDSKKTSKNSKKKKKK
ncbi:helix-turn-helix domain-containing protein [Alcanivorax sp.]|uniref:helix-turn-helix domain-containing protein n=1 Tax=Alcanivorax sp. TaxID=1872427 RepID=UPI0032D9A084